MKVVLSFRTPLRHPSVGSTETRALCALSQLALNWVHLGRPSQVPDAVRKLAVLPVSRAGSGGMGGTALSPFQERCSRMLRQRVQRFSLLLNRLGPLGDTGGRSVDAVLDSLKLLMSASGGGLSSGVLRPFAPSKLLITPGRLSLPDAEFTASFRPEKFLPPDLRRRFLDPCENLRPADERPRAKAARVHVAPALHRQLFERLDAAAMLEFEPAECVPRGLRGESLANGAFQVPKSSAEDRLVLNRTTTNSQERPFNACKWLFPHGSQFCDIVLQPHERLVGSVSDLSVFFYCCGTSRARCWWNQLGRPIPLFSLLGLAAATRFCLREGLHALLSPAPPASPGLLEGQESQLETLIQPCGNYHFLCPRHTGNRTIGIQKATNPYKTL